MFLTHNMSRTVEYRAWTSMWSRVKGTGGEEKRPYYVDKGITVCDRWKQFEAFYADMGPRPSREHSVDRKDNSKGYSPDNCRWATPTEQMRNRDVNNLITHKGVTKCLSEWAESKGLKDTTLQMRLAAGWGVEDAIETPTRERDRLFSHDGITLTVAGWSAITGLAKSLILRRLKRGESMALVLSPPHSGKQL